MLKDSAHSTLTCWEAVDPGDWLRKTNPAEAFAQTLYQRDGYAVTLLSIEADSDDEDDGQADGAFSRLGEH